MIGTIGGMARTLESTHPIGPSPLDDDDLSVDIVASVLCRVLGYTNPSVPGIAREITDRLRAYEIHKLDQVWT